MTVYFSIGRSFRNLPISIHIIQQLFSKTPLKYRRLNYVLRTKRSKVKNSYYDVTVVKLLSLLSLISFSFFITFHNQIISFLGYRSVIKIFVLVEIVFVKIDIIWRKIIVEVNCHPGK